MQAVRSFFPKFDDLGPDPVAAPSSRARWPRFLGERLAQLGDPLFEHGSTHDHLALMARDGAATGPGRPRPPVGVRLIVMDHLHRSGHPDLSVHWQEPMEEGSGNRIRPQLSTLLAFPVGVEDETSVIDASEQHHSGGWAPSGGGGGNCHRLGHGLTGCPRNLEPPGCLGHRIGIDGRFVHGHSLLARAMGQDAEGCGSRDVSGCRYRSGATDGPLRGLSSSTAHRICLWVPWARPNQVSCWRVCLGLSMRTLS